MTVVALILSLLIASLGALGVASPSRLLGLVRSLQTPSGLFFAAAFRVAVGAALLFAAPTSRAPNFLPILGIVIIVAGVITPFFGLKRYRKLLEWWSSQGPGFVRIWAAFALSSGLLLAYAIAP